MPPADPSLLAVELLLTVMEAAMRGGPQVGPSVAWHGNIGITCYNWNWRNNSFPTLESHITVMSFLHSNNLVIMWMRFTNLTFLVVYSPSQLVWPEAGGEGLEINWNGADWPHLVDTITGQSLVICDCGWLWRLTTDPDWHCWSVWIRGYRAFCCAGTIQTIIRYLLS